MSQRGVAGFALRASGRRAAKEQRVTTVVEHQRVKALMAGPRSDRVAQTSTRRRRRVHAVIVRARIKDGGAATRFLRDELVPRVSQAPGFVAGYWVRLDGGRGRGTMVFESEDAARAVAGQVTAAPEGATTLDSVDVGEVVEHA